MGQFMYVVLMTTLIWRIYSLYSQMSEEISKPSLNVPRAIAFSIILNGTLGFGMLLAALFCLGNIEEVLQTPTGYPFMAIFQQAVGSLPGALTMAAIVSLMNICATISFVATASRMTWSFARDRGVPGWQYLSKVIGSLHSRQEDLVTRD